MTKLLITIIVSMSATAAHASGEMFEACEHVSDMAVLAKDNVPFWSENRNSNVQACYSDIEEFLAVATAAQVEQFNAEYAGQIAIYSTDVDFAAHIAAKKTGGPVFEIKMPAVNSLTPVIKPYAPQFFSK